MRNPVGDLLEALALCLCRTMTLEEQPEVCFCGVIPGDGVVAGYGTQCEDKKGLAWVRLTNMYSAGGVGEADFTPGNCGKSIGLDIEVGILRIITVGDADGSLPTDAELLEAASQQSEDALVIRKAITCCNALDPKDYVLGNYTALGPLGGSLGGQWSLSTAID